MKQQRRCQRRGVNFPAVFPGPLCEALHRWSKLGPVFAWLIHDSGRRVAAAGVALAVLAAGCFSSGDRPDRMPPPPPEPVLIDLTQHEQRIDGFGASSAWTANNITDAEADLLFSPTA